MTSTGSVVGMYHQVWLSLVIDSKTLLLLFLVGTLKWNQIVQIPAVPSVPPDYFLILGL